MRVLIPYSGMERRNARPKFFETSVAERAVLPHKRKGLHLNVFHHEQWVRDDRLKAI